MKRYSPKFPKIIWYVYKKTRSIELFYCNKPDSKTYILVSLLRKSFLELETVKVKFYGISPILFYFIIKLHADLYNK